MITTSSTNSETGMTLIELLVVLVLVGLITTMLAGALHFGVRETRLVSGHTERADMLANKGVQAALNGQG